MKYSKTNPPLVCMMTQSTCYKDTRTMTPKGVLWHSTGANNPTLRRYVQPDDNANNKDELIKKIGKNSYGNDWNHIDIQAGLNCWIGELADGTVATVQTMPWNYRPWGCGSGSNGSCNDYWIQFEICEDGLTDETYFNKVYKEACEITAYLCKLYNIDPKGTVNYNGISVPTILCHADSHKFGLGSNHGDVYNWFPKHGKNMVTARDDVKKLLDADSGSSSESYPESVSSEIKAGDLVEISGDATYYSGSSVPSWVIKLNWYVQEVSGDRAVINKSEDGNYSIMSPINTKYLTLVKTTSTPTAPTVTEGKQYKVVTEIARYSSSGDAASQKNKVGTYPAGTYYIYNKYPNGSNGMYNISTDKTGNSAGSWINPSENVIVETPPAVEELYRVRVTWSDSKTQKGAYKDLNNAKNCAQTYAAEGYKVFDSSGKVVYTPEVPKDPEPVQPTPTPDPEPETPKEETPAVPVYDNPTKIVGYIDTEDDEIRVKVYKKIKSIYADFDKNIVEAFFDLAPIYKINPLIAISQSILETGWFRFNGSSVKPEQHNYCGLGATGGGVSGASFETIDDGVHAQYQHLYAYGCTDSLPSEVEVLDPRFNLVSRGSSPHWEELAGKWAVPGYDKSTYSSLAEAAKEGDTYGQKFLKIAEGILEVEVTDDEINDYYGIVLEPDVPETPDNPGTGDKPGDIENPDDGGKDTDTTNPSGDTSGISDADFGSLIKKFITAIVEFIKSLFKK